MNQELDRRNFLHQSAIAMVGFGVAAATTEAQAQDKAVQLQMSRKPPLTEESLNKLLGASSNLRSEAAKDIKAFVKSNFAATPDQLGQLEMLSESQLTTIKKMLNTSMQDGMSLKVSLGSGSDASAARAKKCDKINITINFNINLKV